MKQRTLSLVFCLLAALGPVMAEEPEPELSPDEIIERIVALRRELDALLAALPPELRGQIESRLAGGEAPAAGCISSRCRVTH